MSRATNRRDFLEQARAFACGLILPGMMARADGTPTSQPSGAGGTSDSRARVVIARDEALTRGKVGEHADRIRQLLDAAVQKLTQTTQPHRAWGQLFKPTHRIGIKVNTFGRTTHPQVAYALVDSLRAAGIPAENIIIFDRCDWELEGAGYKLNKSPSGVKCYGTDQHGGKSLYRQQVDKNGAVVMRFSAIVADQVDALVSVPILKHHGMCGVTVGMKNFFGVIHNPADYHKDHGDPYLADLASHPYIGPRWRLTVCDALEVQYHAGPMRHEDFVWKFGGLLLATDWVAADAVGADLIDGQRKTEGLKSLARDGSPCTYIATAGARGLGVADLRRIERVEV